MRSVAQQPSATDDWPMLGHDPANTYCDGSDVQAPLQKVWEFQADGGIRSSPVPAYGMVFFGSNDNHLYALDAVTGQLKWRSKTQGKIVSSPFVANEVVCVASRDKNVYAFDAWTGKTLWKFTTGKHLCSSPAVAYGTVFFGSKDKHVYALDAASGQVLWSLGTDSLFFSAPTAADGKVLITGSETYLPDESSKLFVLEGVDGSILWERQGLFFIDESHVYLQSPTVLNDGAKNYVLLPTSNSVDALDLDSGTQLNSVWVSPDFPKDFRFGVKPFSLAANGNLIFVGLCFAEVSKEPLSRALVNVQRLDFELIPPHGDSPGYHVVMCQGGIGLPAVCDNYLYALQEGMLVGVSVTALRKRWRFKMPSRSASNWKIPLAIGRQTVFVVETRLFGFRKGDKIHAFRRAEEASLHDTLEITASVSESPTYKAVVSVGGPVTWPKMCCLCCGPAERTDNLRDVWTWGRSKVYFDVKSVPYCEDCYRQIHSFSRVIRGFPGEPKGSGVALRGRWYQPLTRLALVTLFFRNERYWASFMELNRLR